MLSWFDSSAAVAFAEKLAAMMRDLVPPDAGLSAAKQSSKLNYAKEKMVKQIDIFLAAESLNIYKTAKLLNTFKWCLKDAGYDSSLIDTTGMWVLFELRRRRT